MTRPEASAALSGAGGRSPKESPPSKPSSTTGTRWRAAGARGLGRALSGQVGARLGAIHDQDLLGPGHHADPQEVVREELPERRIPADGIVLEQLRPLPPDPPGPGG